ncbi:MAG TPA: VOC family protein [Elusimicrobiota bacterium]|nr:VOC family protein [Elusimicrobiota bacterium]
MFDVWHLGLPVEDLERSVNFYVDGLGFELLGYSESERYRMAFARVPAGAFTIELLEYREPSAAKRPDHLAFEVRDLDAFREALSKKGRLGTAPEISAAGPGLRRFVVADPDGVPIQFYEGRAHFDKTALRRKEAHHV